MSRDLLRGIMVTELAAHLGLSFCGSGDTEISSVASVASSGPGTLCFARDERWVKLAHGEAIVITRRELAIKRRGVTFFSDNPRLSFARALAFLDARCGYFWSRQAPDIHSTAIIGRNVTIGLGVKIGAHSRIGNNVVIGDEVIIGDRCIVKSGAIIGEPGFGFERVPNSLESVRLVHIGRVVLDNDVEVGSLTTVCRGTIDATVLRAGCKIDDHVHIAHNVDVGEGAFVIACAEISGGVRIGSRAWIAPGATIRNNVSIGEGALVGMGAVVVKSINSDTVVAGNPAREL